jgi:hypothetical protein
VRSADNVTRVFGRAVTARVADPSDPDRRVFAWHLEETRDDRGNVVVYEHVAEDFVGVSRQQPWEAGRLALGTGLGQRYLKRILYANRAPDVAADGCFEIVFDYGDHDPEQPAPAADRPWPVRSDPRSTYRTGFELRTYRLCRRVLVFHRFAALGPDARLARSTDLGYDERPDGSRLTTVTRRGWTWDETQEEYGSDSRPPLTLSYTEALPPGPVEQVAGPGLDLLDVGAREGSAQWVDIS